MRLFDAVGPNAIRPLERVDVQPIFFTSAPEMNPRTLWDCQPVSAVISWILAPLGRRNCSNTLAFLLPSRAVGVASPALAAFFDLFGFGATSGACGAAGASSRWIAFQIRVTAVLRSVNFLMGFRSTKGATPAKLFQIWTSYFLAQKCVFVKTPPGRSGGVLRQIRRGPPGEPVGRELIGWLSAITQRQQK